MTSNRSRGSILGFVIVGVLLLGLIAGAVYAVRSGVFGGRNTPEIAEETVVDPAAESTNEEDTTAGATKTDELSEALKKQSEAEKKAKEQSQAANPEQGAATQNSQTSQPSSTTPQQLATTGVAGTQLPQTGPTEDALMMIVGAGLVGTAAVAYRRSRSLI